MSKTQTVMRYYNPTIRKLAQEMVEAKEAREAAIKDNKARMYVRFDRDYIGW
jgi:hypothetical protein